MLIFSKFTIVFLVLAEHNLNQLGLSFEKCYRFIRGHSALSSFQNGVYSTIKHTSPCERFPQAATDILYFKQRSMWVNYWQTAVLIGPSDCSMWCRKARCSWCHWTEIFHGFFFSQDPMWFLIITRGGWITAVRALCGFSPPCTYPNPASVTVTGEKLAFECSETDSYKDFVLDVLWRSVFTTKTKEIVHTPHPGRIKTLWMDSELFVLLAFSRNVPSGDQSKYQSAQVWWRSANAPTSSGSGNVNAFFF